MSEYYFEAGDSIIIGNIRSKYRVTRALGKKYNRELYEVEGAMGAVRNKRFLAKVTFIEKAALFETPLDAFVSQMDGAVQRLDDLGLPHIVPVEDFGAQPDGDDERIVTCTVRRLLDAPSLADNINLKLDANGLTSNRFRPDDLKKLFMAFCTAIAPLHEAGLASGNLKPQNLFLQKDNTVAIADLDVGGQLGLLRGRRTGLEAAEEQLWLAPEQIGENQTQGDMRSDIWSLGLLLFLTMSGMYPYDGATPDRMVHNMASPRVARKGLIYLPPSLDSIIDGCLRHLPGERFADITSLTNLLPTAEFTKHCGAGHPNPYWAVHCEMPDCPLGFSKPSADQDLAVYDGWIGCPDIVGSLPVAGYRHATLRLWPKQHPGYNTIAASGTQLTLRLHSSDDPNLEQTPLRIQLLPPPEFEILDNGAEVEQGDLDKKKPVTFRLLVKRSKVMIQHVEVTVSGQANVAECDPEIYNTILEARVKPYPLRLTFHPDKLKSLQPSRNTAFEEELAYDLSFSLRLKNRPKPQILSGPTLNHRLQLTCVSKPKMNIQGFGERDDIRILVYKGIEKVDQLFELLNGGAGQLRLVKAEAQLTGEEQEISPKRPALVFESFNEPKLLGSRAKGENPTKLHYSVSPQNISGNFCRLILTFTFEARYRNISDTIEVSRHGLIECKALNKGRLLAVDFGTTNSMCAAFTTDQDREPTILNLEKISASNDYSLPSVIEYNLQGRPEDIGRRSLLRFNEGQINVFRSFKRHIADSETLFSIYPLNGTGVFKQMYGDQLCQDYIRTLYEKVQPLLGRSFDKFVFTHPTLFSNRKRQAFVRMLQQSGFKKFVLIDEALAGAYHYINENKSNYGLVVYDFGGGTIDITYIRVSMGPQNDLDVKVVDAGGMPNFGGDDVTEAIQALIVEYLTQQSVQIILPGTPRFERLSSDERNVVMKSKREWWGAIEIAKKETLFQNKNTRLDLPPFLVWQGGRSERISAKRCEIARQEVYAKIYPRIQQSIDIVCEMLRRDTQHSRRHEDSSEIRILLSGQSSRIPLVKEMFEAYRQGDRPYWDEAVQELAYRMPENGETPELVFKTIELSEEPKACVAKGAAFFGNFLEIVRCQTDYAGAPIGIHQTITRIGMRRIEGGVFGASERFEEWIPKGRRLVPEKKEGGSTADIAEQNYDDMALAERQWRFSFSNEGNGHYNLTDPIEVYEHMGRGEGFAPAERELAGQFNISKPEGCETIADGRLRIEVTEEFKLRVRARIGGLWIDAHRL